MDISRPGKVSRHPQASALRSKPLSARLKKLCPHPVRRTLAFPVFDALKPGIPVAEREETLCALCGRLLQVTMR